MPRIHFSAEDLAKVRLTTTLGLFSETIFALSSIGRFRPSGYGSWQQSLCLELRRKSGSIERLTHLRSVPPNDLLWVLDKSGPSDESGVATRDMAMLRRQVGEAVSEISHAVLLPHWSRIKGHLTAERDARGRTAITGGVDRLLSTLHPKMRWNDMILDVPGSQQDIHLGGRGILLAPSFFLQKQPAVVIDSGNADETPALAFSTPLHTAHTAPSKKEGDGASLGALIGHTRAAALLALTEAATTSELAKRLGISSAGASQHTGVLRHAGLITTRRNRNMVLHTVTALGQALLDGELLLQQDQAEDRSPARPA